MNEKFSNVLFSDDVIFLNSVYENYTNNVITENQALYILDMVEKVCSDIPNTRDYYQERGTFEGFPYIPVPITGAKIPNISVVEEAVSKDYSVNEYRLDLDPQWMTESGAVIDKLNHVYESLHTEIQNINEKGFYENTRYLWITEEPTMENSGFRLIEMLPLYCEYYALANEIPLEDISIIQGFFENVYQEFNAASMAPVVPLTGDNSYSEGCDEDEYDEDEDDDSEEDDGMDEDDDENDDHEEFLSKFESAEQYTEYVRDYFLESGITSFYEAEIPRNYIPFDTEAKKIWDKAKDAIDGYGDSKKFAGSLNVKKNKYNFKCKPDANEDAVNNAINSCGYTPNRENNKIINWTKKVNNMTLEVSYDGPESGITVSYTLDANESVMTSPNEVNSDFQKVNSLEDIEEHEILESVLDAVEFDYTDAVARIQEAEDKLIDLSRSNTNIYVGEGFDLFKSYENEYEESVKAFEEILSRGNHIPSELPEFRIYEASAEEIRNNPKIDDGIKDILVKLNKLGYKTKYSCTGHSPTRLERDGKKDGIYHGKLYTTARINFDKVYNFATMPDNWYQSNDGNITSIYVKPCNYDKSDGSVDTAFDNWKKRYMNALTTWVDELPPADETTTESPKSKEDKKFESALYELEQEFLESCIH